MATSRRRVTVIEPEDDANEPFRDAMRQDNENIAEEFAAIAEEWGGVSDGSVRAHLYKVERTGKYMWLGEYWPPFEQSEIFRECRERWEGGNFQLRIVVSGKRGIQKAIAFGVAPAPGGAVKPDDPSSSLFQIMMTQQADARRDAQASADRQMQMMMQMGAQTQTMFAAMQTSQNQLMGVLIPAMMGGREKTSDIVAMVAALKGDGKEGLAGMFETMKAAKDLFGGDGGEKFDADDLIGSAVRVLPGVIGSAAKAFQGRGPGQPATAPEALAYQGGEQLALPQPVYANPAEQPTGYVSPSNPVNPAETRFPLLALVRDDIGFMFARRYDPGLAAEAVYDRVTAFGATPEQMQELALAFLSSPDPWGELAAEGIDLRSDPQWADGFLQGLVAAHAEAADDAHGDADLHGPERRAGGAPDPGPDGGAGEGGRTAA